MTELRTPQVSVVMSCHNASRWLDEAADSVLAQTFSDFEFLLVDDGSIDDTPAIIEKYRALDSRVVAVPKKHSGLADSLNVGLARARGTWIARLDADDRWEPERLEKQMRFALSNPDVVLLGTNFLQMNGQGVPMKRIRCPSTHRALLWNLEHLQRFFPHSSALFRREAALEAGSYNPWNRLSEDSDLWLRLAEKGKIACLGEFLVSCRKHPEQISNTKAAGSPQLVYGFAAAISHFLRINGYPDPSRGTDEGEWNDFVAWIDRRIREEGIPDYHTAWSAARASYFASRNRLAGAISAAARLVRSGQTVPLVSEKLFGLSLPRKLAHEWMKR
ncbi:MAG TPA: glycosyltransferase [Gemmatimonadaceae bacterium]|nr:glycosyltransferase [Gemmatimonadaceae bacterium]